MKIGSAKEKWKRYSKSQTRPNKANARNGYKTIKNQLEEFDILVQEIAIVPKTKSDVTRFILVLLQHFPEFIFKFY